MFLRSLEKFINREDVCQTQLVVSPADMEEVKNRYGSNLAFMGVTLTEGGKERLDSVAAALEKVAEDAALVAVHDAARPCVSDDMIDAVFSEAAKSGAAILASPVTSTLKRVSDANVVDETLDRAGIFEAQTPQVFKREIIVEAYASRNDIKEPVTDDSMLVERSGHPVAIVESDATNMKVTRRSDMPLASAIIKSRPAKRVQKLGAFEGIHAHQRKSRLKAGSAKQSKS